MPQAYTIRVLRRLRKRFLGASKLVYSGEPSEEWRSLAASAVRLFSSKHLVLRHLWLCFRWFEEVGYLAFLLVSISFLCPFLPFLFSLQVENDSIVALALRLPGTLHAVHERCPKRDSTSTGQTTVECLFNPHFGVPSASCSLQLVHYNLFSPVVHFGLLGSGC